MSLSDRSPMRRCGVRYDTGLQPGAVPEECWIPGCGGWHVRTEKATAPKSPAVASDTGPDRKTRLLVLKRDGYACVCCAATVINQRYSLQHRKRRSQGGGNCASNLLTVLGDGVSGCHQRMDSRRDPEDEAKGYTVRSTADPHLVSVMVFGPGGGGATLFPTCSGEWSSAPGERVA